MEKSEHRLETHESSSCSHDRGQRASLGRETQDARRRCHSICSRSFPRVTCAATRSPAASQDSPTASAMAQPLTLRLRDTRSDGRSNAIRKPQKLGSYSVRNTHSGSEYEEGEGQLRVLHLPVKLKRLSYDLCDGYIRMRDGGSLICSNLDKEPGLKNLLKWVLTNRSKFQLQPGVESSSALNTDFITYRGVITRIMSSPYEKNDGWCIGATKYKGTIFLYEFMTEKKMEQERNRDERSNMCSYGGFRFEHYITRAVDQEAKGDEEVDLQNHNEYCCVARTRLGRHSLAYGAEMDCICDASKAPDPELSDFCEIKTTRSTDNQRQWDNLVRFKMFKWWAQCYLIGTPSVVCGYRDDNLIVREIKVLQVADLPKLAAKFWSPDVCLRFLDRFLDFAKRVVVEDDPKIIYEFNWEPGTDVTVRKTSATPDRFVIPQWFIDAL